MSLASRIRHRWRNERHLLGLVGWRAYLLIKLNNRGIHG
jgi:hypothetical protein